MSPSERRSFERLNKIRIKANLGGSDMLVVCAGLSTILRADGLDADYKKEIVNLLRRLAHLAVEEKVLSSSEYENIKTLERELGNDLLT